MTTQILEAPANLEELEAAALELMVPVTPEVKAKHRRYASLLKRESAIKGEKEMIKKEIEALLPEDALMFIDPKTGKSVMGFNPSHSTSLNKTTLQAFLELHGRSLSEFMVSTPNKTFFSAK